MALTNYIGQTAMILIAGSVCNFAGNLTYMQTLYVCIAIYVIQIIFSVIWMKIFKMGPLEWVWRVITYWTVTPLKNKCAVPFMEQHILLSAFVDKSIYFENRRYNFIYRFNMSLV